jgi:uncharacterized membrane protein YeiH
MSLLYWFNQMGTAVFALTGVLTAVRKKFDPIGIVVISTVTAIGGGTIRDLLLGIHPIGWIRDVNVLFVILVTVVISLLLIRFARVSVRLGGMSTLLLADALGLALFTLGGTQIAEQQNVHWLIAMVMGTITGSAGGVIRDVLTNEEPLLFKQTELYATASLAGAGLYLLLEHAGLSQNFAAILGMIAVSALRLAALKWKIRLPVFAAD